MVLIRLAHKLRRYEATTHVTFLDSSNPPASLNMQIFGIDAVAIFWGTLFNAIPDSLFVVHESKLRVLPNGFTALVCKFTFTGECALFDLLINMP